MGWKENMTAGVIADVQRERERQKEGEGWTPEHDAQHAKGEMAWAAAAYAVAGETFSPVQGPYGSEEISHMCWPVEWADWWKPKCRRRNLVRAAALLVAEIERMDVEQLERDGPAMASREISR